jgi:hypothetical protein
MAEGGGAADQRFDPDWAAGLERIARTLAITRSEGELIQSITQLANHVSYLWNEISQIEEVLNEITPLVSAISVTNGSITIQKGHATVQLKADGSIDIRGSRINVVGTSDVKIKGSKVAAN